LSLRQTEVPQVKSQSPRAVLHDLHSALAPFMAAVQCTHAMQRPYAQDNTLAVLRGRGGEGTRNTDPPSSSPSRDVVASNLVSHSEVCRFRVSKRPELAGTTMTMHAMHDQGIESRFPGNADISLFATYTRPGEGHNGFPIHRIHGSVSSCYSGRRFKLYKG